METIILASGSERRQEYFRLLGLPFSVKPAMIEEKMGDNCDPAEIVENNAVMKVKRIVELMSDQKPLWICGADTVVSLDNKIFGKAKDREDAGWMLGLLSGREHKVVSAVALYCGNTGKIDIRTAECYVRFANLVTSEIEWYLNTCEWKDVAGAYRLQGLAACFITSINGAPSTVVGLPLHEFYDMLRRNGYPYGA